MAHVLKTKFFLLSSFKIIQIGTLEISSKALKKRKIEFPLLLILEGIGKDMDILSLKTLCLSFYLTCARFLAVLINPGTQAVVKTISIFNNKKECYVFSQLHYESLIYSLDEGCQCMSIVYDALCMYECHYSFTLHLSVLL